MLATRAVPCPVRKTVQTVCWPVSEGPRNDHCPNLAVPATRVGWCCADRVGAGLRQHASARCGTFPGRSEREQNRFALRRGAHSEARSGAAQSAVPVQHALIEHAGQSGARPANDLANARSARVRRRVTQSCANSSSQRTMIALAARKDRQTAGWQHCDDLQGIDVGGAFSVRSRRLTRRQHRDFRIRLGNIKQPLPEVIGACRFQVGQHHVALWIGLSERAQCGQWVARTFQPLRVNARRWRSQQDEGADRQPGAPCGNARWMRRFRGPQAEEGLGLWGHA